MVFRCRVGPLASVASVPLEAQNTSGAFRRRTRLESDADYLGDLRLSSANPTTPLPSSHAAAGMGTTVPFNSATA